MLQSEFDQALILFDSALHFSPNNIDILKDILYTNYLKRDYANAIETGKKVTARQDADVQCFQMMGLCYKAIANYKECDKLYKAGLKKFPRSGMLYGEYGDLFAIQKNYSTAIQTWEKGIEADPNASSNYYYAAKYYAENNKLLWALYYGETFVNIESFTNRTAEIKNVLYNCYKKIYENGGKINAVTSSPFEKALAATYTKLTTQTSGDVTPETITALRTRFILEWFAQNAKTYPSRLFDHQKLLLEEGYFDAYNQWLVGSVASTDKLQDWMNTHADEVKSLQQFQRSTLYKIPAGQYYPH